MNGLITDLYQLTMANALFNKGRHERKVVFDRFTERILLTAATPSWRGLSISSSFGKISF